MDRARGRYRTGVSGGGEGYEWDCVGGEWGWADGGFAGWRTATACNFAIDDALEQAW